MRTRIPIVEHFENFGERVPIRHEPSHPIVSGGQTALTWAAHGQQGGTQLCASACI